MKPKKTLKKAMYPQIWYCGRCGAKVPANMVEKASKGTVPEHKIKKCPSCNRVSPVFDFIPSEENVKKFLKSQDVKKGMKGDKSLPTFDDMIKDIPVKEENKELRKSIKDLEKLDKEDVDKIKQKMADPNLLVDTVKETQKEVSGEEDTIISEILVATTRLVKGAIPESKNLAKLRRLARGGL